MCRKLTFLDDVESEQKAPAAAIMTKNKLKTFICFYFDNIDMEKGACGRYINRQKCIILVS